MNDKNDADGDDDDLETDNYDDDEIERMRKFT